MLSREGSWTPIEEISRDDKPITVYNFEVEDNHSYFVGESGILSHNCDGSSNSHLEDLPLHERHTRFYAKASELLNEGNIKPLHPINEEQMFGSPLVGHGGVRNLSNENLLKFGGPQGNDPIRGFRDWNPKDNSLYPGSQINIRGGHHRLTEIRRRVESGSIPPDTLIEFLKEGN